MSGLPVDCFDVRHVYRVDESELVALDGVYLSIPAGSTTAITGPSGSGKSTLVNLLAGLHRPTSGEVFVGDADFAALSQSALLRARAEWVGVAVQNPARNLLPYGDAVDNIRFAQRGSRVYRLELPDPMELLGDLGLAHLAGTPVDKLSGGERQRIAVAVAMSGLPGVLIADEPTSQLDSVNRDRVVELLRHIADYYGTTVVTVTHDPTVAAGLDRSIELREGRLARDGRQ
jgi:ABC-type lipoprotein export system ATPase subunit